MQYTYPFTRACVSPHSIIFAFKANPNHVLRDEAARAAEEGRDYVSAQGIDQALQVRCASFARFPKAL